jgi:hypothetical protein
MNLSINSIFPRFLPRLKRKDHTSNNPGITLDNFPVHLKFLELRNAAATALWGEWQSPTFRLAGWRLGTSIFRIRMSDN